MLAVLDGISSGTVLPLRLFSNDDRDHKKIISNVVEIMPCRSAHALGFGVVLSLHSVCVCSPVAKRWGIVRERIGIENQR